MAGCYGNSKEDRYFESQLYDYLDGLEEGMNDNIEITQEEAELFLSVIGEMPASFEQINEGHLIELFHDDKQYDALMKMWYRIKNIVSGDE